MLITPPSIAAYSAPFIKSTKISRNKCVSPIYVTIPMENVIILKQNVQKKTCVTSVSCHHCCDICSHTVENELKIL